MPKNLIGKMTIELYSSYDLLPEYREEKLELGRNVLQTIGELAIDIAQARLSSLDGYAKVETEAFKIEDKK